VVGDCRSAALSGGHSNANVAGTWPIFSCIRRGLRSARVTPTRRCRVRRLSRHRPRRDGRRPQCLRAVIAAQFEACRHAVSRDELCSRDARTIGGAGGRFLAVRDVTQERGRRPRSAPRPPACPCASTYLSKVAMAAVPVLNDGVLPVEFSVDVNHVPTDPAGRTTAGARSTTPSSGDEARIGEQPEASCLMFCRCPRSQLSRLRD